MAVIDLLADTIIRGRKKHFLLHGTHFANDAPSPLDCACRPGENDTRYFKCVVTLAAWAVPELQRLLRRTGISLQGNLLDKEMLLRLDSREPNNDLLQPPIDSAAQRRRKLNRLFGQIDFYSVFGHRTMGLIEKCAEGDAIQLGRYVTRMEQTDVLGKSTLAYRSDAPSEQFADVEMNWGGGRASELIGWKKREILRGNHDGDCSEVKFPLKGGQGTIIACLNKLERKSISIVKSREDQTPVTDTDQLMKVAWTIAGWFYDVHEQLRGFAVEALSRSPHSNAFHPVPLRSQLTTLESIADHLLSAKNHDAPARLAVIGPRSTGKSRLFHELGRMLSNSAPDAHPQRPLVLLLEITAKDFDYKLGALNFSALICKLLKKQELLLDEKDATRLLSDPNTILLMDGLDRLPPGAKSSQRLEAFLDTLKANTEARALRAQVVCVLPDSYDTNQREHHFPQGTIALSHLQMDDAVAMLKALLRQKGVSEELISSSVSALADRMANSPRVRTILTAGLVAQLAQHFSKESPLSETIAELIIQTTEPLLRDAYAMMTLKNAPSPSNPRASALLHDTSVGALAWAYVCFQGSDAKDWLTSQRPLPASTALETMAKVFQTHSPQANQQAAELFTALTRVGVLKREGEELFTFENIAVAEVLAASHLSKLEVEGVTSVDALVKKVLELLPLPVWRYTLGLLFELEAKKSLSLFHAVERQLLAPVEGGLLDQPGPEAAYQHMVLLLALSRDLFLCQASVKALLSACESFSAGGAFRRALVLRELERLTRLRLYVGPVKESLGRLRLDQSMLTLNSTDGLILKYSVVEAIKNQKQWLRDEAVVAETCIALLTHLARLEETLRIGRKLTPDHNAEVRLVLEAVSKLSRSFKGNSCFGHTSLNCLLKKLFPTSNALQVTLSQQTAEFLIDSLQVRECIPLLTGQRYNITGGSHKETEAVMEMYDVFKRALRTAIKILYREPQPGELSPLSDLRNGNVNAEWGLSFLYHLTQLMGFFSAPQSFVKAYRTDPQQMWVKVKESALSADTRLEFQQAHDHAGNPDTGPSSLDTIIRDGLLSSLGAVIGMALDGKAETSSWLLAERISSHFLKQCIETGDFALEPMPTQPSDALLLILGLYTISVTGEDPNQQQWQQWMAYSPKDLSQSHWLTRLMFALVQIARTGHTGLHDWTSEVADALKESKLNGDIRARLEHMLSAIRPLQQA